VKCSRKNAHIPQLGVVETCMAQPAAKAAFRKALD
jgi:hypothetical protein